MSAWRPPRSRFTHPPVVSKRKRQATRQPEEQKPPPGRGKLPHRRERKCLLLGHNKPSRRHPFLPACTPPNQKRARAMEEDDIERTREKWTDTSTGPSHTGWVPGKVVRACHRRKASTHHRDRTTRRQMEASIIDREPYLLARALRAVYIRRTTCNAPSGST